MTQRLLIVVGGLLALLLAACAAPVAPGTPTAAPTPVIAASAEGAGVKLAWEKSKHAASFVADTDGANNICARCHSPHNWTPTDPADMPETCASCKFTIKTPKPVAKTEWKSIPCEVCHRVDNGVLSSKVAYLNTAISQFETGTDPYETVASNRELCEKCHRDHGGFYYRVDMGKGAHSTFDCTRCHNPHGVTASCTASGCHTDALKPAKTIAGHDTAHAEVTCVACHDASALKVGPTDGKKNWVTWRASGSGGSTKPSAYVSHALQRTVDCTRCHYSKNPWGISESVK